MCIRDSITPQQRLAAAGADALCKKQKIHKKALLALTGIWMAALAVFAVTDNYYLLLAGMFCAMGASTLLNTKLHLVTPCLLYTSPLLCCIRPAAADLPNLFDVFPAPGAVLPAAVRTQILGR